MNISETEKQIEFFKIFTENAHEWEAFRNETGKILYVNQSFERITGFSWFDFLAGTITEKDVIHPDDWTYVNSIIQKSIEQKSAANVEFRIIRKDATIQHVNLIYTSLFKNNEFIGSRTSIREIQEIITKNNTEDIEEIFNQFLKHSPYYVFFKDAQIRAIHLSHNFEKMTGIPHNEMIGKTMYDLFTSELAKSMIADDLRLLQENKPCEIEEIFNERFYTTIKFPIHLNGKPPYLAGFTIGGF